MKQIEITLDWGAAGQWHVPKTRARFLPVAVRGGFCNWSFVRQPSSCPKFFYFFFSCPTLSKETDSSPRGETLLVGRPPFFSYSLLSFFTFSCPWRVLIVGLSNVTFCRLEEFVWLEGIVDIIDVSGGKVAFLDPAFELWVRGVYFKN